MRMVRIWQQVPDPKVDELPEALARDVVDAIFVDQLAPGQLERAATELPKYIEALRRYGELSVPGDPDAAWQRLSDADRRVAYSTDLHNSTVAFNRESGPSTAVP